MVEAVASPGVEIFGIHELVLNASSKSGYKDVYPLQRKKRPWQAKVWDAARQSHVSLGSFGTPREAAVAVRCNGSHDRPREPSESGQEPCRTGLGRCVSAFALPLLMPFVAQSSFVCLSRCAGKRKLEAIPVTAAFGAFVLQLVILDPAAAHGDAAAARSG